MPATWGSIKFGMHRTRLLCTEESLQDYADNCSSLHALTLGFRSR